MSSESKRSQETRPFALGLSGSILLFLGVFAPLVSIPILGSMNYFQNGKGDGTIILVLAVFSFIMTLREKTRGLIYTGVASLLVLGVTLFVTLTRINGDSQFQALQLQWGWAIMVLGAALLIASATSTKLSRDEPRTLDNRYVLVAVFSVVAVITVNLIGLTLEPPPAQQQAPPPGAGQTANPADMASSEQMMQQMMSQIEHIKGILVQDSSNFDAWAALGNMYFDIQMPEEAITHYRGALKVRPDDLNVQTDLATMLRGVGQQEEAVKILESVVATDSTKHQAWFNLGVIYSFDFKDNKKALAAWKRFVALNPQSPNSESINQEIIRLEGELGS